MSIKQADPGDLRRVDFDDYTKPTDDAHQKLVHEYAASLRSNFRAIDKDHSNFLDPIEIEEFGKASPDNRKLADFLARNFKDISNIDDNLTNSGGGIRRPDVDMLFDYSGSKTEVDAAFSKAKDNSITMVETGAVAGTLFGVGFGIYVGGPAGVVPGACAGAAIGTIACGVSAGLNYWTHSKAEARVQNLHV